MSVSEERPRLKAADLQAGQVLGTVSDEQLERYRVIHQHRAMLIVALEVAARELAGVCEQEDRWWTAVRRQFGLPPQGALEAFGLTAKAVLDIDKTYPQGSVIVDQLGNDSE